MKSVMITGGTGMIGQALGRALLEKGYQVILLTRDASLQQEKNNPFQFAYWDPENGKLDPVAMKRADCIVHLAGAGIADKRWTAKRKEEIVRSRVGSAKLLSDFILNHPGTIKSIVSASAIGWYGPDPQVPNARPFSESDPAHPDFLGTTCRQWEESWNAVRASGTRVVCIRTGIVLSKNGGALDAFRKPLRYGIATILGNGKQVISWIHIQDLVNIYIRAIESPEMNGSYNAVAPYPVTNREFVMELATMQRGKRFIPVHVPSLLLRIALGEMSVELLKSATVSSSRIQMGGYEFQYPRLYPALASLK